MSSRKAGIVPDKNRGGSAIALRPHFTFVNARSFGCCWVNERPEVVVFQAFWHRLVNLKETYDMWMVKLGGSQLIRVNVRDERNSPASRKTIYIPVVNLSRSITI